MKKIYVALITFLALSSIETTYTRFFSHSKTSSKKKKQSQKKKRSHSSLRHLKNIRVGKSKTIRGYEKILVNPKSNGEVHINKIDNNKHTITGMKDGIVILNFYDEDGLVEEKAIDIKERKPDIIVRPNVSFGLGWGYRPRGYYYISSDPFYSPYWGWGPYWNRPYYNYYW